MRVLVMLPLLPFCLVSSHLCSFKVIRNANVSDLVDPKSSHAVMLAGKLGFIHAVPLQYLGCSRPVVGPVSKLQDYLEHAGDLVTAVCGWMFEGREGFLPEISSLSDQVDV